MFERIAVVGTLRIEYRHGFWQRLIGHVVVADDKVDAERLSVCHFLHGLYSAVEYYNELYPVLIGVVDALFTHAVTFVIAVGNVVLDVRIELL